MWGQDRALVSEPPLDDRSNAFIGVGLSKNMFSTAMTILIVDMMMMMMMIRC
jgi:hypothetical protein